eukprot:COSAG01_NODE_187_length_22645_cov_44.301565_10_plen_1764_part_00
MSRRRYNHVNNVYVGKDDRVHAEKEAGLFKRETHMLAHVLFVDNWSSDPCGECTECTQYTVTFSADGGCIRCLCGTRNHNADDGFTVECRSRLATAAMLWSEVDLRSEHKLSGLARYNGTDTRYFTKVSDLMGGAIKKVYTTAIAIMEIAAKLHDMAPLLEIYSTNTRDLVANTAELAATLEQQSKAGGTGDLGKLRKGLRAVTASSINSEYVAKLKREIVKAQKATDGRLKERLTMSTTFASVDTAMQDVATLILGVLTLGCDGDCKILPSTHPMKCGDTCMRSRAFTDVKPPVQEADILRRAAYVDPVFDDALLKLESENGLTNVVLAWEDKFTSGYYEIKPFELIEMLQQVLNEVGEIPVDQSGVDKAAQMARIVKEALAAVLEHTLSGKRQDEALKSLRRLVCGREDLPFLFDCLNTAPDVLHIHLNSVKAMVEMDGDYCLAYLGPDPALYKWATEHGFTFSDDENVLGWIGGKSDVKAKTMERTTAAELGTFMRNHGMATQAYAMETRYLLTSVLRATFVTPDDFLTRYYDEAQPLPPGVTVDYLHVQVPAELLPDEEYVLPAGSFFRIDHSERCEHVDTFCYILRCLAQLLCDDKLLRYTSFWQLTRTMPKLYRVLPEGEISIFEGDCSNIENKNKVFLKPAYKRLVNSRLKLKGHSAAEQLMHIEHDTEVAHENEYGDVDCPRTMAHLQNLRKTQFHRAKTLQAADGPIHKAIDACAEWMHYFRVDHALDADELLKSIEGPVTDEGNQRSIRELDRLASIAPSLKDQWPEGAAAPAMRKKRQIIRTELTELRNIAAKQVQTTANKATKPGVVKRPDATSFPSIEQMVFRQHAAGTRQMATIPSSIIKKFSKKVTDVYNALNRLPSFDVDCKGHPGESILKQLGTDYHEMAPFQRCARLECLLQQSEDLLHVELARPREHVGVDSAAVDDNFCPMADVLSTVSAWKSVVGVPTDVAAKTVSDQPGLVAVYYSLNDAEDEEDYAVGVLLSKQDDGAAEYRIRRLELDNSGARKPMGKEFSKQAGTDYGASSFVDVEKAVGNPIFESSTSRVQTFVYDCTRNFELVPAASIVWCSSKSGDLANLDLSRSKKIKGRDADKLYSVRIAETIRAAAAEAVELHTAHIEHQQQQELQQSMPDGGTDCSSSSGTTFKELFCSELSSKSSTTDDGSNMDVSDAADSGGDTGHPGHTGESDDDQQSRDGSGDNRRSPARGASLPTPVGFMNGPTPGSTVYNACWLHSGVHMLGAIPSVREFLAGYTVRSRRTSRRRVARTNRHQLQIGVVEALAKVVQQSDQADSQTKPLSSTDLGNRLEALTRVTDHDTLTRGAQHSACESLILLLDVIFCVEQQVQSHPRCERDVLLTLHKRLQCTQPRCDYVMNPSIEPESIWNLAVPSSASGVSLESCIAEFCETEYMTDWSCPKSECTAEALAEQQERVSTSTVLLINLVRETHSGVETDRAARNNAHVTYKHKLDVPQDDGSSIRYRLTAVMLHHSTSAAGGHYTTLVRRTDGHWFEMNDDQTTALHPDAVLRHRQAVCAFLYVRDGDIGDLAPPTNDDDDSTGLPPITAQSSDKDVDRVLCRAHTLRNELDELRRAKARAHKTARPEELQKAIEDLLVFERQDKPFRKPRHKNEDVPRLSAFGSCVDGEYVSSDIVLAYIDLLRVEAARHNEYIFTSELFQWLTTTAKRNDVKNQKGFAELRSKKLSRMARYTLGGQAGANTSIDSANACAQVLHHRRYAQTSDIFHTGRRKEYLCANL